MRPETKAYNFDWMLWRTLDLACNAMTGTEKELKIVMRHIPYFKDILDVFLAYGEPGKIFLKLVYEYMDNIMTAHEKGKKICGTTFCFSPAILYAMDTVPVTLELVTVLINSLWKRGIGEFSDFCYEAGLTETSCSSQRGALGAYLAGLGETFDFIVADTPGVCDTNANAFAFASAYLNKPAFALTFPDRLTGDDVDNYHQKDYRRMIDFLEEQTGNRLDTDRLREVLQEIKKQDEILAELEELQRAVPSPLPVTYNFFIYAGRFFFAGKPLLTELLLSMRDIAVTNMQEERCGLPSGKENTRALFCYIDHYTTNLALWSWLEERGITHMGNILSRFWADNTPYNQNRSNAYNIDSTNLDTMIDSLAAQNSRMPMVKSIRGPYDAPGMWLEDTLSLAQMYRADCIIYSGTPGCRNTWGMVKLLARDTEEAGFPTHIMYSDSFDERVESWEATSARLDEFFAVRGLL